MGMSETSTGTQGRNESSRLPLHSSTNVKSVETEGRQAVRRHVGLHFIGLEMQHGLKSYVSG